MSSTTRRILFLTDVFHGVHGGTEGQLAALVAHLPEGWEAELWVLFESRYLGPNDFPCPWRLLRLPGRRDPRRRARLGTLARAIAKGGFDLVHGFHAATCALAPRIGRQAGVPVLTSRRDLGYWQTPPIVDRLRRANHDVLGIVTNSEAAARRTVEVEWAHPHRVFPVPNGHDLARFESPPSPSLRDALEIPETAPLIGLLANHRPLKRPEDLGEALARLGDETPDAYVLFIGNRYADAFLEAVPASVRSRVRIHPVQGDVIPVVRQLTVGVLCSESEGLSNAIIEYMGCGVPVVATDVGGNPELVVPEETGFLYPVGDVDALAAHLRRLLGDAALRERMGRAARARVAERFALPRMVRDMTSVYDAAIADWHAPVPEDVRWRWIENEEELEEVTEAWEALCDPHHFFASPVWVRTWLEWSGCPPRVLVGHDPEGALVAVLPLAELRSGVLGFAGQEDGADHLDLVAAPERAPALARGALSELARRKWRRVEWRHVREGGALRHALHDPRRPMCFVELRSTVCPYLERKGSWDEYLGAKFSRKRRHELRRSVRRFLEREDARVTRVEDPAEIAEAMDRLFVLHAKRLAVHGLETPFAGAKMRDFHTRLAARLLDRGQLFLASLRVGPETLAAYYGFRFGGKIYHFQSGIEDVGRGTSPGTVLRALVLEHDVFAEELAEFDFLDGDEAYKFQWATGTRRLFDVVLHPHTPGGRIRSRLTRVKRWLLARARRLLRREGSAVKPP